MPRAAAGAHRPRFLAIVSSNTLATTMLRRASGRVDGLVIESPTAGGHNAPPRGKLQLNAAGEPVYGERDRVNIEELRALGVPFWLAGGYGNAEKLREALDQGAAGCRWEPRLRSAGNPACGRPEEESSDQAGDRRRAKCLPIRWPRRPDFRSRLRSSKAPLRSPRFIRSGSASAIWAICASRTRCRWQDRLPLLGGAGGQLRGQGRQDRGHGGPQVPVQRADGQHRPRADAQGWLG
jgi:hypothetical protein